MTSDVGGEHSPGYDRTTAEVGGERADLGEIEEAKKAAADTEVLRRTILLTNLTRTVTEGHLREIGTCFGNVETVRIIAGDKQAPMTRRSEIVYVHREAAEAAKLHLDQGQIDGQVISVRLAEIPETQQSSPRKRSPREENRRSLSSSGGRRQYQNRRPRHRDGSNDNGEASRRRRQVPLSRDRSTDSRPRRRSSSRKRTALRQRSASSHSETSRSSRSSSWSSRSRSRSRSVSHSSEHRRYSRRH